MNKKMDFADWLQTNRKQRKFTLMQLADMIDNLCSYAFLSQLENRKYLGKKGEIMKPDKKIVVALAKVFGENPDLPLRLCGYASETTNDDEFMQAVKRELADSQNWSDEQKEKVLDHFKLVIAGIRAENETK